MAFAYSNWIDRYVTCERSMNAAGISPGRHRTLSTSVADDASGLTPSPRDVKKWGMPFAFLGTKDGKAGVWLVGNGLAYFGELGKPETTIRQSIAPGSQSISTQREQTWVVRFEAGDRPAVDVTVNSAEHGTIVSVAPKATFLQPTARGERSPAASNDLRNQMRANLLERLQGSIAVARREQAIGGGYGLYHSVPTQPAWPRPRLFPAPPDELPTDINAAGAPRRGSRIRGRRAGAQSALATDGTVSDKNEDGAAYGGYPLAGTGYVPAIPVAAALDACDRALEASDESDREVRSTIRTQMTLVREAIKPLRNAPNETTGI